MPPPASRLPVVIAIDGPAASGKSTTAAAVAREIGAQHLDSGSLYRALTVVYRDALLEPGASAGAASTARVLRLAEQRITLQEAGGSLVPFLDGLDAEPRLRTAEVNALVSEVSSWAPLRDWVNTRLHQAASDQRPLVLDGRDIGTVVFPGAAVKVFLTATPEARARRRLLQRGEQLDPARLAEEASSLRRRDALDSTRPIAPLRPAADAFVLDTTAMDFSAQVGEIVRLIRAQLPGL